MPESLEELGFIDCTNIKDISNLTKLKNLKELAIQTCWISDITPLGQMKQLKELWMSYNCIYDISPLSGLTNLNTLYINNNRVTDITPLKPLYSKKKDLMIEISCNPIKDYSFLNDAVCKFGDDYSMNKNEIAEATEAAKKMVNLYIKPGMTDYEKYKVLAVELCKMVTYDYAQTDHCGDAYGALIENSAVCAGYAEAYIMLCTMAGLPCYEIDGQVPSGSHAWNIIKLDGKYYHVDTTWMDDCDSYPISGFYFLKSDAFFLKEQHSDFVRDPDLICSDTSRDKDTDKIG